MGKEENTKERIPSYATEKGAAVGSRDLCCLIFYAVAMQSLLSWFVGGCRLANLQIATFDWIGAIVALTTLLFYTKIVIDDLMDTRSDVKISIPYYCFAWLAFVFQAGVLPSSNLLSIASFVIGVYVLTTGMLKNNGPQTDLVRSNVRCELLFASGSVFLSADRFFASSCCRCIAIGFLFAGFLCVVLDLVEAFAKWRRSENETEGEADSGSRTSVEFELKITTSSR
jgi:hypothetical protein